MPLERAAYGAHLIAASNMIRAIKAVSTERGRDPREFALFAFGGNGPLFAAGMAAALGITRIVVPPSAGLFSSFGLLYADVEHHYARTFRRLLRQRGPERDRCRLERAWRSRRATSSRSKASPGESARLTRSAALHYKGQSYELIVPVPDGPIDARMVAHLEEAFGAEHERTYGHRAGPEEPVELVAIQLVGSGLREGMRAGERRVGRREQRKQAAASGLFRRAGLAGNAGACSRGDLRGGRAGPLIVEEYDATCLVPPGARAELDAGGNIVIAL